MESFVLFEKQPIFMRWAYIQFSTFPNSKAMDLDVNISYRLILRKQLLWEVCLSEILMFMSFFTNYLSLPLE